MEEKRRKKQDWVEYAKEIMKSYGGKIVLPNDLVISDGILTKIIKTTDNIPPSWSVLDIGPTTQKLFSNIIQNSGTVFLAGPMGKFEDKNFSKGSVAILKAMKDTKGETIIAGGDTIDAVQKYGKLEDYSHISLAGGATIEFLANKELPALKPLIR